MLYIRFGEFTEDCIVNINSYFDYMKTRDWFNNDIVRSIIKEIDNSDAIKDEYIESPVLGAIAPTRLSCGCKAVILMQVLDKPHIYGTRCGDNCVGKIIEISRNKDITLTLHHCMKFPDIIKAYLVDYNREINSFDEFVEAFYDFKRGSRKA